MLLWACRSYETQQRGRSQTITLLLLNTNSLMLVLTAATLTHNSLSVWLVAAWLDKPQLPRHPWPSSQSLCWFEDSAGACLHFMHWKKKDLILFVCVFRPWASRCFLGYPGWYQISPVRLLLYQPRCPPAKQMTAALHTHRHLSLCDKRHVSPSPIHLSSISYYCQEEIATRMALQQEPAVNSGRAGGCLSSTLAVRCCYFTTKSRSDDSGD